MTYFQSSGAATVASGFATIATGGLALPVIGGLGAVAGVAGGVWNFMGSKKKDRVEKSILEHIKDIVEEDKSVQEDVRNAIAVFQTLDDDERCAAGEQIMAIMRGWGAVALNFGPETAMYALSACLIPIGAFFTGIPTVMAVLGAGVQAYLQCAANEVADDVIRAAVENAGKNLPNNWTKKYIVDNALGELSRRGGRTYVSLTEEGAKALADEAAAAVAKEAARVSQIVGGVTVGLGALSCIWDIYQISKARKGSKAGATTELGEALRRIVKELKKSMGADGA